jgi:hypothetical protein
VTEPTIADTRRPLSSVVAARAYAGSKRLIIVMNRIILLDRLGQAERHIRDGERHILRQREIIDELERHGRGQTRTASMARDILQSFETAQLAHLADRKRLIERLQAKA